MKKTQLILAFFKTYGNLSTPPFPKGYFATLFKIFNEDIEIMYCHNDLGRNIILGHIENILSEISKKKIEFHPNHRNSVLAHLSSYLHRYKNQNKTHAKKITHELNDIDYSFLKNHENSIYNFIIFNDDDEQNNLFKNDLFLFLIHIHITNPDTNVLNRTIADGFIKIKYQYKKISIEKIVHLFIEKASQLEDFNHVLNPELRIIINDANKLFSNENPNLNKHRLIIQKILKKFN